MAVLVQVRADVYLGANAVTTDGVSGEALDQATPIYLSNGKYYKCDNSDATKSAITKIAVTKTTGADQKVVILTSGDFHPGAAVVANELYIVSSTSGGIEILSDLQSGEYLGVVGYGVSTSLIRFAPFISGVAKA